MPYRFHGQRSNEEVVLVSKQHPFTLLKPLLASVFILFIPQVFYVVMNVNAFLGFSVLIALLLAGLNTWRAWYSWSNTILLVTDERIVYLEQRGFLSREFFECDLANVQQLSHAVKGALRTLLGYGDIAVYTGAATMAFLVPNMPEPYEIQQEILRVRAGEGYIEEE